MYYRMSLSLSLCTYIYIYIYELWSVLRHAHHVDAGGVLLDALGDLANGLGKHLLQQ